MGLATALDSLLWAGCRPFEVGCLIHSSQEFDRPEGVGDCLITVKRNGRGGCALREAVADWQFEHLDL